MNSLERSFNKMENELTQKLEHASRMLQAAPSGELKFKRHRGKIHYFTKTVKDGKTKYVYIRDNEKSFVRSLAEKAYYMNVRKFCMSNLDILRKNKVDFICDVDTASFAGMNEACRIVMSEINNEKQAEIIAWVNESYIPNPHKPERLIYPTLRGEKVRSKGERDIVDELYREGIPYKLEHPVEVGGETIYCDIVILRLSDKSEIFWEHSGMLDKDHYIGTNYDRIAKYASAGILIGENLIITGETKDKPLSTKTIKRIIDAYCR